MVFCLFFFLVWPTVPQPKKKQTNKKKEMKSTWKARSADHWVPLLQQTLNAMPAKKRKNWLLGQLRFIQDSNGPNYSEAVKRLLDTQEEAEEEVCLPATPHTSPPEEEDYVLERVPMGPKGMTELVKVPKSVFTG